jgi:uncharacterized protein DUF3846
MRAIVISGPHGSDWKETDIPTGLEPLQSAVGGLIEALPIPHDMGTVFINEDGVGLGLPMTAMWTDEDGNAFGPLRGNLVLLGPVDSEGETQALPRRRRGRVRQAARFALSDGPARRCPAVRDRRRRLAR